MEFKEGLACYINSLESPFEFMKEENRLSTTDKENLCLRCNLEGLGKLRGITFLLPPRFNEEEK